MKLSPLAHYHLSKLLYRYANDLECVLADGAGLCANFQSDLNKVLESLYLEDEDIAEMSEELETLTRMHRTLWDEDMGYSDTLDKLEKQIFWILGLKRKRTQEEGIKKT